MNLSLKRNIWICPSRSTSHLSLPGGDLARPQHVLPWALVWVGFSQWEPSRRSKDGEEGESDWFLSLGPCKGPSHRLWSSLEVTTLSSELPFSRFHRCFILHPSLWLQTRGNCPAPCGPSTPSYTLRNTSILVNHLLCICFPLGSKDVKEIIKLNINMILFNIMGFHGSSHGKESTCNAEDPSFTPGLERPPGRSHSSILAWKIPWTEEPGGLWSMGLQKSQKTLSLLLNIIITY